MSDNNSDEGKGAMAGSIAQMSDELPKGFEWAAGLIIKAMQRRVGVDTPVANQSTKFDDSSRSDARANHSPKYSCDVSCTFSDVSDIVIAPEHAKLLFDKITGPGACSSLVKANVLCPTNNCKGKLSVLVRKVGQQNVYKVVGQVDERSSVDEVESGFAKIDIASSKKTTSKKTNLNDLVGSYVAAGGNKVVGRHPREVIISAIQSAKQSIDLFIFCFDDKGICSELIEASKREVKVFVLADKGQSEMCTKQQQKQNKKQNSIMRNLAWDEHDKKRKSCKVQLGNCHPKSNALYRQYRGSVHTKLLVIDNKIKITGSYNYTEAAQNKNLEDLVVTTVTNEFLSSMKTMIEGDIFEGSLSAISR